MKFYIYHVCEYVLSELLNVHMNIKVILKLVCNYFKWYHDFIEIGAKRGIERRAIISGGMTKIRN